MFLFLFIASAFAHVTLCNNARNYQLYISSVSLYPSDEVVAGQMVTLRVNYSTPVPITEGTSKTTVRYHGWPLPPYTESICNIISCPIKPGKHNFTYSFPYPYSLPGRTMTNIIWYDSNVTLMCLTITLRTISNIY